MTNQDNSKWIMQPQMLIALSALVLSVCGIGIAVYEAALTRQSQRSSVWPYVEVGSSFSGDNVKIWIRNTGVGPARVKAASVIYKGETLTGWKHLLQSIPLDIGPNTKTSFSLLNGRVIAANSPLEPIFEINNANVSGNLRKRIVNGEVNVAVCYCSVFDECWVSELKDVMAAQSDFESQVPTPHCDISKSGI